MTLITMRQLGRVGRFGNSLFQYAFLKTYAKKWGLSVQTAPWVGQTIYEIDDPPVTVSLLARHERRDPRTHQQLPPVGREFVRTDFIGYAQYHTSYYRPDRDYIRQLFRVREKYRQPLADAVAEVRGDAKTLVGLHIRRGDYGHAYFPRTPLKWFRQWLAKNWPRWEQPQLAIATEDRKLVDAFKDYGARLMPDRPILDLPPYFPDFHLLTQCDVLAASESSFSFFAAMLNTKLQELWQSQLDTQGFVQLDPWDADVLPRKLIAAYPHLKKLVTTDADSLDPDTDLQDGPPQTPTLS